MMDGVFVLTGLVTVSQMVHGEEYCETRNGTRLCPHDCCGPWHDQQCCKFSLRILVISVIAITLIIVVIGFTVILCCQHKQRKKRVVRPKNLPEIQPVDPPSYRSRSSITYVVVPPGEHAYSMVDTVSYIPQPPPYPYLERGLFHPGHIRYLEFTSKNNISLSPPPTYVEEPEIDVTNSCKRKSKRHKKRKGRKNKEKTSTFEIDSHNVS